MEDTIKYVDDKYEGAAKYLYEVLSLPPGKWWGSSQQSWQVGRCLYSST